MYNFQQQINGNSSNINSFPGATNNFQGTNNNFSSNINNNFPPNSFQATNNNIQIQSAYSYNSGINSPVPQPQMQGRMSMGPQNFNNQGCPSPMMSNFNQYNPQMYFTDAMMTSPGCFSSFFNLNDAASTDNIVMDDMMSFDPTPRKRNFNYIQNPQMDQIQGSAKKMHMEEPRMKTAPTNDNYRRSLNIGYVRVTSLKKVFACFIGNCRFKTFSCQQFVQHLSFCHSDQRDVLRGFCMLCENFDCGCSIYNEFVHIYGHSGDQVKPNLQNLSPQPESLPLEIKEVVSQADFIKKEAECEINDETNFVDQENETIMSNDDETEVRMEPEAEDTDQESRMSSETEKEPRMSSEIEEEPKISPELAKDPNSPISNVQLALEETQIIPMEPPTDVNANKTIQIKQEPVDDNLEATMQIPEPKNTEESDLLVPIFKSPTKVPSKKPNKTLRKRAMSTYVETDKKSPQNNKKQKSQTTEDIDTADDFMSDSMCLDFISKKIMDAKEKEKNDKFNNFKPNESIFKLVEVKSLNEEAESPRKSKKDRREANEEKLKSKFNKFSDKRKEFSSRRKLRPRKSDEQEEESKVDSGSSSNITIDNILEKIMKNTATKSKESARELEETQKNKQKSSITEYFQKPDSTDDENLSDDLMLPNQEEKTPKKKKSSRKLRNSDKENEEKAKERKSSLRSRGSDENEQKISRNQEKTAKDQKLPEKTSKDQKVTEKTSKDQKLSQKPAQNPRISIESSKSTSFNEKSSTSINTSSTSALEVSKLIPQTIDIEALFASASSSFEFGSIKELYPWIDENITSGIFKTKTSIDILLNEFSLFSTYKCMNELCYFFTTDLEEFKKHARSHDSYNNYCCYCLNNFDKSNDLCSHLEVAHKFDRFQCSKCMFRSCQKGYVDVHQRIHHPDDENCEVFKSPVQKLLKSDRSKCLPALQKNREKLVMPYRCKTPKCKEIFYSKDNFRKHLEMESNKPNCQEFVTLICQQLYSIDHSRTSNNTEGIFQCLHCQYGTDESDIFDHMALNHPHEFAYVCKRVKPQKLIELNIISARETVDNSTSIEYIGTTTAEAKNFGGELEKLNSTILEKEATNKVKNLVVNLDD